MEDMELEISEPVDREPMNATSATGSVAPILVAVDLTAESEEALRWACDYAERVGAPVDVLHVVHDPAESPGKYRSDGGDLLEPMNDVASRKLTDFLAEIVANDPGLSALKSATLLCTPGIPAGTILDVAERHGARLLVVGSRGRGPLASTLFGSTSQRIARRAAIPVTIVKPKPE